jgi:2'-5' RNA ligase
MTPYRLPAFIVLEIPPPVSGAIQSLRDSLATLAAPTVRLPVEITVAGSSGVGPIPPGTDRDKTEAALKSVLAGLKPFSVRFQEIRRFPNTNIFYLAPQERQPFDRIYEALAASGITFAPSRWPYNPHCTLRGGPMTDRDSAEAILTLPFPKQEFVIDTVSVYELDPATVTCHLSFQSRI